MLGNQILYHQEFYKCKHSFSKLSQTSFFMAAKYVQPNSKRIKFILGFLCFHHIAPNTFAQNWKEVGPLVFCRNARDPLANLRRLEHPNTIAIPTSSTNQQNRKNLDCFLFKRTKQKFLRSTFPFRHQQGKIHMQLRERPSS